MGESRNELLAWLNDLTQLGYTKVEQCGTGAAHCAIVDSIYRDVPLAKVKFNAKHEYEYVANFKILQAAFDKHGIENAIPVTRLIKCKFQDNLEFLQWLKKYWDQYYPGGSYDAIARRKADISGSRGSLTSLTKVGKKTSDSDVTATRSGVKSAKRVPGLPNDSSVKAQLEAEYQKIVQDLTSQVNELNGVMDQVTKEREFYFNKLREIEVLVQQNLDGDIDATSASYLKTIQDILYKTEEGFEIPTADA